MYEEGGEDREIYVDFLSPQGLATLKNLKSHLQYRYSERELISILEGAAPLSIPTCIFSKQLSLLEAIIKYLKENKGFSLAKIARLLNRAPTTISTTYAKAKKKQAYPFLLSDSESVPVSAIADRRLSTFEALVLALHGHTIAEIAYLLDRDSRVVWEIRRRALSKVELEKFLDSIRPKLTEEMKLLHAVKDKLETTYQIDFVKLFKSIPADELIPLEVFKGSSPLKSLASYLKSRGLSIKQISERLNRSAPVISTSIVTLPKVRDFSQAVPLDRLVDRNFSVMENLVAALLEEGMTVTEIALATGKQQPVISKFKQRWKTKSEKL